jgi:hypothetical protein
MVGNNKLLYKILDFESKIQNLPYIECLNKPFNCKKKSFLKTIKNPEAGF